MKTNEITYDTDGSGQMFISKNFAETTELKPRLEGDAESYDASSQMIRVFAAGGGDHATVQIRTKGPTNGRYGRTSRGVDRWMMATVNVSLDELKAMVRFIEEGPDRATVSVGDWKGDQ